MSLKTFVANECANWLNARCIMLDTKRCPVMQGERCSFRGTAQGRKHRLPYFESAVLPLAKSRPEYAEAAFEYQITNSLQRDGVRYCLCGEPLAKRKRTCDECRKKKRSQAQRNWRRENKGNV